MSMQINRYYDLQKETLQTICEPKNFPKTLFLEITRYLPLSLTTKITLFNRAKHEQAPEKAYEEIFRLFFSCCIVERSNYLPLICKNRSFVNKILDIHSLAALLLQRKSLTSSECEIIQQRLIKKKISSAVWKLLTSQRNINEKALTLNLGKENIDFNAIKFTNLGHIEELQFGKIERGKRIHLNNIIPIVQACTGLKKLKLSQYYCTEKSLQALFSLSSCQGLLQLEFSDCKILSFKNFYKLFSLDNLIFKNCGLKDICEGLGDIPNLRYLDVSNSDVSSGFLKQFENHKVIRQIDLFDCPKFSVKDIKYLKNTPLTHIGIGGKDSTPLEASALQIFQQLPETIESIELANITYTRQLPKIDDKTFKNLKSVIFPEAFFISKWVNKWLPIFFEACPKLEEITIKNWKKKPLNSLFENLPVKSIKIFGARWLKTIHFSMICANSSLSKIELSGCKKIRLEDMVYSQFPNITSLTLHDIDITIDDIKNLYKIFPNLEILILPDCTFHLGKGFQQLSQLKNLKYLDVRNAYLSPKMILSLQKQASLNEIQLEIISKKHKSFSIEQLTNQFENLEIE